MLREPIITDVRFHCADDDLVETGLLGFVAFDLDGHVHIDGVAIRKTLGGRLTLSFPAPRRRAVVAPLNEETRRSIERQVFDALRRVGATL